MYTMSRKQFVIVNKIFYLCSYISVETIENKPEPLTINTSNAAPTNAQVKQRGPSTLTMVSTVPATKAATTNQPLAKNSIRSGSQSQTPFLMTIAIIMMRTTAMMPASIKIGTTVLVIDTPEVTPHKLAVAIAEVAIGSSNNSIANITIKF